MATFSINKYKDNHHKTVTAVTNHRCLCNNSYKMGLQNDIVMFMLHLQIVMDSSLFGQYVVITKVNS